MSTQNHETSSQFTWIDFYKELADNLLAFKNNRSLLFDKLKTLDIEWIKFMLQNDTLEWKFSDIDPFSVFAILNRSTNIDKRLSIAKRFKDLFQLHSDLPSDFKGIPILDARRSCFFDFSNESIKTDIDPLWDLFQSAIYGTKDDDFVNKLDIVVNQKEIGWKKITMALYWIRPNDFITLDSLTQAYLISYGIQIAPKMTGTQYIELIDTIRHNTYLSKTSFPKISLEAWLTKHSSNDDVDDEDNEEDQKPDSIIKAACDILRIKKNIILQGAPGTGKTYSTAEIALRILGVNVDFRKHEEVMKRYRELCEQGRICFTTFHQSMDYEDFVEGLKPVVAVDNDGNAIGVSYEIEDGIFKDACKSAIIANNSDNDAVLSGLNNNSTIWKINLVRLCGDSICTDCLNNNYICLPRAGISEDTSKYKSFLRYIQDDMQVGDVVFLSHSSREIDAIGIVSGEYVYREDDIDFPYSREVHWIVKDISENIVGINQGKRIANEWFHTFPSISITHVLDIINKYIPHNNKHIDEKPVVLIIDEINRGNVSKIFGELVTLLEADKRDDGKQESGKHTVSVILPYSKERFSVPSNVYIIGTMNTTDRSTGTLDYAIRRRFAFVTLPAEPNVVPEGIARELFNDIREFIKAHHPEDMDINDLMVGHSYFMPDEGVSLSTEEQLKLKIKYEVAPLLREYCTDGLLTCSQKELEKRIKFWEDLKTYNEGLNAASAAAASGSETSQTNE